MKTSFLLSLFTKEVKTIIEYMDLFFQVMELKVRPRVFSVGASVGADFDHFSFQLKRVEK